MVKIFVALTDQVWFRQLAADPPDEVNSWQPSGARAFRALSAGGLFLFKLHAPQDFIVGGGVFSHASNVPLSLAWDAFGLKTGSARSRRCGGASPATGTMTRCSTRDRTHPSAVAS